QPSSPRLLPYTTLFRSSHIRRIQRLGKRMYKNLAFHQLHFRHFFKNISKIKGTETPGFVIFLHTNSSTGIDELDFSKPGVSVPRSEEHTPELQSRDNLV